MSTQAQAQAPVAAPASLPAAPSSEYLSTPAARTVIRRVLFAATQGTDAGFYTPDRHRAAAELVKAGVLIRVPGFPDDADWAAFPGQLDRYKLASADATLYLLTALI